VRSILLHRDEGEIPVFRPDPMLFGAFVHMIERRIVGALHFDEKWSEQGRDTPAHEFQTFHRARQGAR
jgi:hypothetical protein